MIWVLFALIQLVSLALTPLGWFICLLPYTSIPWLWRNSDDLYLIEKMSRWDEYVYLAWRNPVANLRHVPGVSGKGRPLYYRNWLVKGKQFYFKCGWMSDGLPCFSAGSGKGF
jgi:hypothetical protein